MSIKDLKEDLKSYRKCIKNYQYDIGYDIEYFVQHSINLFEDFEKRIKKLEAGTNVLSHRRRN